MNNKEYIFKMQIEQQISFALYELNELKVTNILKDTKNLKGTEKCFLHIQNLLSACADISKLLFNDLLCKLKSYKRCNRSKQCERCVYLREQFNVDTSGFPLLKSREMRNAIDHFDERLDEFSSKFENYAYIDCNIGPIDSILGKNIIFMRHFDNQQLIIYVIDKQLTKPHEMKLDALHEELINLQNLLNDVQ